MSKFNNLNALALPEPPPRTVPLPESVTVERSGAPAPGLLLTGRAGLLQRIGLVLLCTYIFSVYANDVAFRFLHAKTPLSIIAELSLPLVLLLCGAPFRALRTSAGKMWVFFLCWLILDTPFSVWRTGSAMVLMDYGIKCWPQLLYIASFAVTLTALRRFMYVQIVSALLLLLLCYTFGRSSLDSRFDVHGSFFFNNANELAMRILFGIAALMLMVIRGKLVIRILGAAAIFLSLIYILRTGSRGGLLATIALFGMITVLSKHRVPIVVFGVLAGLLSFLAIPDATRERLKLAFSDKSVYDATTTEEVAAIASRMQRQQLLRQSIQKAITNPIVGVGPGQFAVAVSGDAEKKGERAPWLGTHNSYTQVACECGMPAFICYMGVLVFSFRLNYRVLKATKDKDSETHKDMYAISFALLGFLLVYAVCTFFDHIAYSELLPMIGGCSISLKLLAEDAGIISDLPQRARS